MTHLEASKALTGIPDVAEAPVGLTPSSDFSDTNGLKRRAVNSAAYTGMSQIVCKVIQVGSTAVLARILTPHDYGLLAMILVVSNFLGLIKDMGLSQATIQKDKITHEQISTLFWVNVAFSSFAMVCVMVLAPLMAWFYDEPRLVGLTIASALGFIITGFGTQHTALLQRELRFGRLALVQIAGTVLGATVGIVLALLGAGVWSLVLSTLSGFVFGTIAVWVVEPWRPGPPVRNSGAWGMLAFGGCYTGFLILDYFSRYTDKLLLGRYCGAASLGFYNQAYDKLLLPVRQVSWPISAVAVPTLSRLQKDPDQYRNYYYRAINIIAFLTVPMVLMMAALSEEIIRILLGPQWEESAHIFKILAFAALFQPVVGTTGWIFLSWGRTKQMFIWGLVSVPVLLVAFLIGLRNDITGVALAYTICSVFVLSVPGLLYAFHNTPIRFTGFLRAIHYPFLIGLVMYAAMEAMCLYLEPTHMLLRLFMVSLVGIAVFGGLVWLLPGARSEFKNLRETFKMISFFGRVKSLWTARRKSVTKDSQ